MSDFTRTAEKENAAPERVRSRTRLYVGIFKLLVGTVAFYIGAADTRLLPVFAGVVISAMGIHHLMLRRRRRR
jgi:uncharacterized membrane protein HdeD (DUF308 family)